MPKLCRTLQTCTVLPNAVKLRRTAESLLCYVGKLCRGNSYVPRLCETRLRQKRNKNEKSTHVRKSDPINSESHTRHSRNHPCPTPSSRKNIGPSPQWRHCPRHCSRPVPRSAVLHHPHHPQHFADPMWHDMDLISCQ